MRTHCSSPMASCIDDTNVIPLMKAHRGLIGTGAFFRLISPSDESQVDLQPGTEAATDAMRDHRGPHDHG